MRNSPRPCTTGRFSDSTRHQLNTYALAAGAAGVSLLALAGPAEAKIVYTATNQQIAPNGSLALDLNGDGKVDFNFHATFTCTSFCEYKDGSLTVIPGEPANEVFGHNVFRYRYASALAAGVVIGPGSNFATGTGVMARGGYDAGTRSTGICLGPWKHEQHHYLGLKFAIAGQIHYGWARLNETCGKNGENSAVLTGYAYETIAYKPISAGKISGPEEAVDAPSDRTGSPVRSSIGALALGAPGMALWRREETDGAE